MLAINPLLSVPPEMKNNLLHLCSVKLLCKLVIFVGLEPPLLGGEHRLIWDSWNGKCPNSVQKCASLRQLLFYRIVGSNYRPVNVSLIF